MRWLHISDLHFGEMSAKQNYLEAAIGKREKPDFIVVTGDLHTYPKKPKWRNYNLQAVRESSTYKPANEFLCSLLDHWGLTKDDIFIVPGNHDVDVIAHYKELKALSIGTASLPRYENGEKSSFMINRVHLSQRFYQYTEFIRQFFGENHVASQDSAGVFIRTWNNKINILHTNTALYSTANNANEQHALDTYALSKLSLNDTQKKLPTLCLGHHNFFRLEQYLQDDVKTALGELNVVAYLCGDKHVANHDKIDIMPGGRTISVITCMASAIDRTLWSEVGILEYSWDENLYNPAQVIELRWDSHRNEFSTHPLSQINMDFGKGDSYSIYLRREIREQIENLNPDLLPRIKDEIRDTVYENESLQGKLHSEGEKRAQFPLAKLFFEKRNQSGKQFYLFEGRRSTRGGTGKTSSLLSAYRVDKLCQEFQPVYIRLRSLYQGTLTTQVDEQVGPRNGRRFLLLLDGFDEITSDELRKRCISEILNWNDKHYKTDVIIMTGRDHLEFYLQAADIDKLAQEDTVSILKEFDSYKVLELTPEQQRLCLGEPLPDETNRVWDILDNPFFVSRYRESKKNLIGRAKRWLSPYFSKWLSTAKSENRTSLMLGALLYEVNRLGVGEGFAVERKRFILTKLLPALAYRKLLADRTADSGMPIDGTRILGETYIIETLLSLLNMYSSILQCWPEYNGQLDRDNFYHAWGIYWKPGDECIRKPLSRVEYFIGPLTTDSDRNYCFSHMIYQEFFAAFHIANVVYALSNGLKISEDSKAGMDMMYILVEHIDHHILLQAEEILEQYWGMPFYTEPKATCQNYLYRRDRLNREGLVMCQILIRFLDASIMNSSSNEQEEECKKERHIMYEWFNKDYLVAIKTSLNFQLQYKQFYLYTVALLARDFRIGTGCTKSLNQCGAYVQRAIKHQRDFKIPKADGYLQMGLFLDTLLEQLVNGNDSQIGDIISQIDLPIGMANEIFMLSNELCSSNYKTLSIVEEKYKIRTTPLTRSGATSYYELLRHAKEAYQQCNSSMHNLKLARKLGYISKAYLVLSALGTSGGALNRLGLMFENQTNAMEHYPQTAIYRKMELSGQRVDLSHMLYEGNYVHSYKMYQIISEIKRGDQPYSSRKLVELILKGRVSVENGLDHPTKGDGKRVDIVPSYILAFLEQAVQKADNGISSMSHYWHGRILLIRANIEKNNKEFYLKSACDFFHREEVTHGEERICYNDYLIAKSKLPVNVMLSAIELLSPALRAVDKNGFGSSLQEICEAILYTLEKQLNGIYLKTDNPTFSNEHYCVSPIDVLENIARFRGNAGDLMDRSMHSRLKNLQNEAAYLRERFW